jgi:hypothetical protein
MLPDLRHFMTPTDALNAFDGPLAATKPPENLAAEPIAALRALAVSRHQHRASPVHFPLSLLAPQSLHSRPLDDPHLTIAGAIRSP